MLRIDWRASALAMALLATACTTDAPTPVASTETASVLSGAPSPIPGYDWHLTANGGESRLVYGMAESDASVIGLSCADGSGQVELFSDVDTAAPAEFHMESGGDTTRVAASSEPSAMTGGQYLTAETGAGDAVFRRFRSTGWLALWRGDERTVLAAQPGSSDNVDRFFAACG